MIRLGILELSGTPIAAILFFDYNNVVYLYNSGYDLPNLWEEDKKIKNVIEGDLAEIIMPVFCGRCKEPDKDTALRSSCDICAATKWGAEIEAIIMNEGAEYMLRLAKEWKVANKE